MQQLRQERLGFKKTPSSSELLEIIFDHVAKIANEKDLDNILILLADLGRELVLADRCTLWLLDREKNEIWTKVAHGMAAIRRPMPNGLSGYAIANNEPLIIDDAYLDSRFDPGVDKQTGYRTKAVLVIPLRDNQGQAIGAFQAINKLTRAGKFSPKDLKYLTLAASYSSKALETALLNWEIEETQKEIIHVMGEIGESRSKETGNHVTRVAEYSKLLALKYGMDEAEAELIKIASPMHDIGKVAISDSILLKPGKLDPEEFAVMQSHTRLGFSLLGNSPRKILKAAAVIAHQHHEKWDGTGYPLGLKGESIHIYGRITALADVFDALASDRCYKKAWELDRILGLLNEERGRQFDPQLVDIFLSSLEDMLAIRDSYRDEVSDAC